MLVFQRTTAAGGEPPPSDPQFNLEGGYWEATLASEYQAKPAKVEILLPNHLDSAKKYPVLYILPVEAQGSAFGHGLIEAKKADIANKYEVICVYPSFTSTPWFGNHATDPQIRQDDYVVRALVPYIDSKYPTQRDKEGRWLIGFSKSGWGAYTLLFRHPDVFGYAGAWDVPFMLDGDNSRKDWGPMGLSGNMGSKEVMQQFLPTKLATENASWLKARNRLVLGRGIFWKSQNEQMHTLLDQLKIPHAYLPDLLKPHRWDTGWFPPMVDQLVRIARAPKS